jgi:FkbM family methyltransferase
MFSNAPDFRGKGSLIYALNRLLLPRSASECIVTTKLRLGYTMKVDLRSLTESLPAYTGDYDNRDIRACLNLLSSDSVALDVGANIGFWTVPIALKVSNRGHVHAFEPLPRNCERLRENLSLNGLGDTVCVHEIGLSDKPASVAISLREDFSEGSLTGNASIVIDDEDRRFDCTTIEVDTLDRIFDSLHLGQVDFIKADIEGHEDRFLAGANSVISRFRPALFIEINEPYYQRRGIDVDEIFQSWLSSYQYVCALRTARGWRIGEIRMRKPVIDNLLFLPRERHTELLSLLH